MRLLLPIFICLFACTFAIAQCDDPPTACEPEPLVYCDDNNDGIGEFTLTDREDQIRCGDPGGTLTVTYHEALSEAENDVNPLFSPYLNILPFNQTVFARLTDIATGCFDIVELDLIVLNGPIANTPEDLILVDVNNPGDEVEFFDLTVNENIITGGDPSLFISYHLTEDAAEAGFPVIANPTLFANSINPQTIYVRVQSTNNFCFELTSFNLIVQDILSVANHSFGNVTLVPNPAIHEVIVSWSQSTSVAVVNLYSIRGELVQRTGDVVDVSETSISLADLASGVYFVQLVAQDGQIYTQKLIKK